MQKTEDTRIVEKVLEMVAAHYDTTPETLKSANGDPIAKKTVMYILKEGLGTSIRTAKEAVNKKYDPDVYAAVKKIKERLQTDAGLATKIEEIKTEVLMMTALPDSGRPTPIPTKRTRGDSNIPARPALNGATEHAPDLIGKIQQAVTKVFLGADLLRSPDPAADVLLAKDVVVFLAWDDSPAIPLHDVLETFHLDEDGFHRAVGRIVVKIKRDESLQKKLQAARTAYSGK